MEEQTVLYPLEDTKKNRIHIRHPSSKPDAAPLYTFRATSNKTFNAFRGDTTGPRIGAVTLPGFSKKIEISLHSRTILLKPNESLGGAFAFTDDALGGKEVHWKEVNVPNPQGKEWELLDSSGKILCAVNKGEGFHMYVPAEDEALLDVVVVTGTAAILYGLRERQGWVGRMLEYMHY